MLRVLLNRFSPTTGIRTKVQWDEYDDDKVMVEGSVRLPLRAWRCAHKKKLVAGFGYHKYSNDVDDAQ